MSASQPTRDSQRITLVPTGDERPMPPTQDHVDAAKGRVKAALLNVKSARMYTMHSEVREYIKSVDIDLQVALEYLR
jgi:hypothetical protein